MSSNPNTDTHSESPDTDSPTNTDPQQAVVDNVGKYVKKLRRCVKCEKKTRSHALFLTHEMELATEETHDIVVTACHSCFKDTPVTELLAKKKQVVSNWADSFSNDGNSNGHDVNMYSWSSLTSEELSTLIKRVGCGDYEETERTKTIGENTTQRKARQLKGGDVFYVNEFDTKWVIIPNSVEDFVIQTFLPVNSSQCKWAVGTFLAPMNNPEGDCILELYPHTLTDESDAERFELNSIEVFGEVD